MLYAYIGIFILTVALIGFVVYALSWLSRRVSDDIRSRSLKLMGVYDDILEQRSEKLKALNDEIRKKEEEAKASQDLYMAPVTALQTQETEPLVKDPANAALNAVEKITTAEYRNSNTSDIYRMIREQFRYDPVSAVRAVADLKIREGKTRAGAATALLEELDYNVMFRLSSFSEEDQYRLLYESVFNEALPLLEEYRELCGRFDAIGFYDWLQGKTAEEPTEVRLLVPSGKAGQYSVDGIPVEEAPDLTEGFLIEADNVIYDFGVRESEIS